MASPLIRTVRRSTDICYLVGVAIAWLVTPPASWAAPPDADIRGVTTDLEDAVLDRFADHCFDCHGYGEAEGGFSFESLVAGDYGDDSHKKWEAIWLNVRSETMPPASGERPDFETRQSWLDFIVNDVFELSADAIDPGAVVLRRLNHREYERTVEDLTGVRIKARDYLPADNTGYGFDTIGEVLSLSPVMLERYIAAATDVSQRAIPVDGPQYDRQEMESWSWRRDRPDGKAVGQPVEFGFDGMLFQNVQVDVGGKYELRFRWKLENTWLNTAQSARATLYVATPSEQRKDDWFDSPTLNRGEAEGLPPGVKRLGQWKMQTPSDVSDDARFEFDFEPGKHQIFIRLETLNRAFSREIDGTEMTERYQVHLDGTALVGPMIESDRKYTQKQKRVLFNGPPPQVTSGGDGEAVLRQHTRDVIERLVRRAFRRPGDDETIDRLTEMARRVAREPGRRYEHGIAAALKLVLVSPRFLYRIERPVADAVSGNSDGGSAPLDDYALAVRLSYFLWGTMPDEELMELADAGTLHEQLDSQIDRMLQSWRIGDGLGDFVGQWLKTRDLRDIQFNNRAILRTKDQKEADRIFNWRIREAMIRETHEFVEHLIIENRPIHELLNARYTFLNERLADYYGIDGVEGDEFRKVELPEGSHRRGILTHGSVLLITSNPSRTSPVKRGLFVLENLLGVPAPPAPPDVPELTESRSGELEHAGLRAILEKHRSDPACASCHSRMDPLGLAMENYDALGRYRDQSYPPTERWWDSMDDDPIAVDAAGTLMTGESFDSVMELADVLANDRRKDFYRCITEKWMTFAVGRGLTYRDAVSVEQIVDRLIQHDGGARELIRGIVHSPAFSRLRVGPDRIATHTPVGSDAATTTPSTRTATAP